MKRLEVLTALGLLMFSGYVGYTTNYTNVANASEVDISPKTISIPTTSFKLDLQNEQLYAKSTDRSNLSITILKKDSIVYRTKYKTKKVFIPYLVREAPPVLATKNSFKVAPAAIPEKINLDRKLSSKTVYKGFKLYRTSVSSKLISSYQKNEQCVILEIMHKLNMILHPYIIAITINKSKV